MASGVIHHFAGCAMTVDVSLTAPMAQQEKTTAAALMEYSKW